MAISITQVEIENADDETGKAWNDYLATKSNTTYYHTISWKRVIERTFGYRPLYLMATEGSRMRGVLPLFEVNSLFLGKFLSSIPCATYGGPVADEEWIGLALAEEAMRLAQTRHARYLEFRGGCLPLRGTQALDHYVTFVKDLTQDPEVIWRELSRDARNQIRKAWKSGLTTRIGGRELLPAFHHVYTHSVRDLGSPPQGLAYFEHILEEFAGSTRVLQVERSGETIGGCILLDHQGVLSIPFMTSLRRYFAFCPNNLLNWEAIRYGCLEGLSTCDFGRSTVDTGPYHYKKQWGGRCVSLPYQYYLVGKNRLPDVNPYNPRFQAMIKLWQHIPVPLAKALGPALIRQLAE
jgi:FemAB-related protein (PEP-CTERM system-associated)